MFSVALIAPFLISTALYGQESTGHEETAATEVPAVEEATADLSTDDVAYLTQLGLLRGHLRVGNELYQQGLADMALTHMKHPGEELYADLVPAFAHRGCNGFADQMVDLADTVATKKTADVVDESHERLDDAITQCEAVVQDSSNRRLVMQVVTGLLEHALLEYEIGVIDGAIDNVHEFQDAWGFTQVASAYLGSINLQNDDEGLLIVNRIQALIASLEPMWPSLNPTQVDDPDVPRLVERLRTFTTRMAQLQRR